MAAVRQEQVASEEERLRLQEDDDIASAQAELDAMLSGVDMNEEITDDLSDAGEEKGEGSGSVGRSHRSVQTGEPRFQQTSALDGVQFDPSEQELYEMDSIFSDLSADASICTDDKSRRAFEDAIINAAVSKANATSKATQDDLVIKKAAKARHRVQKMQVCDMWS